MAAPTPQALAGAARRIRNAANRGASLIGIGIGSDPQYSLWSTVAVISVEGEHFDMAVRWHMGDEGKAAAVAFADALALRYSFHRLAD